MSGTGINSAPEVIYPYKCSGSHDPAYPPAECPECRAWVEKYYPGFTVEDASTPIDPPIPLKHGGFLTVQRWYVLKTADGRVICGGTNAEGVIGSVAYQLHRWGTAESPKPTANAADQSAEDEGCNCSRNMPYFHWSHARTCPLYVAMPQPAAPIAPAAVSEIEKILQILKDCCDRDWKDETPEQVAVIVSNAMFWRNDEIRRLRDKLAKPSAEGDGWIAWDRPPARARRDIVGQRNLLDGRTEYLMHNEALCSPYYVAVSPLPAPPSGQGEVR